ATLFVLILTLIAAVCAAGVTGWQAWIARDQEHRALRAYVVESVELRAAQDGRPPFVYLSVENMGQTPVYDLIFNTWASVLSQYEAFTQDLKAILKIDCLDPNAIKAAREMGHTFSKMYSRSQPISGGGDPLESLGGVFEKPKRVIAVGTVCYRDIFGTIHTLRLCYEWAFSTSAPERCTEETQGEQDD
ncbi:MAG: hypothetical protein JO326_09865, partial [Acetobacteraceae bacterium]|nr:hypothetical protein [Acetobacteraceae bacterium]